MTAAPHSAELLAKLAEFDTPTICNALEIVTPERRLTGFTTRQLVCPFPDLPPIVGYARTAMARATHAHELSGKPAREQRVAYYEYIASKPGPTITCIQDLDGHDVGFGAFWGEVHTAVQWPHPEQASVTRMRSGATRSAAAKIAP